VDITSILPIYAQPLISKDGHVLAVIEVSFIFLLSPDRTKKQTESGDGEGQTDLAK
jgi:hypothetical protein